MAAPCERGHCGLLVLSLVIIALAGWMMIPPKGPDFAGSQFPACVGNPYTDTVQCGISKP